ncbi:MAG TPA: archease [Vicinamibacterales bacterium]|nr:archease [Vicinamibacterales bacterium]
MGYAFVDHTADVAAELTGRTLGELFVSAAQALTDTITELSSVHPAITQSVTLESGSVEDLLVDWLNELLYRFEVQNMLVSDATVAIEERTARWYLSATIAGEPCDPARHPSRVLVKSATYHGLSVTQKSGTWRARIVFDI